MTARDRGPNRSRWQRERIVGRSPDAADETRITCERGGGSSRFLSSAFWAASFMVWASSMTNTRRRASNGAPAISPTRSRTWSTRISGSLRGRPVRVSHQPSASTRSGCRRKLRHTSSSGWRSASWRISASRSGRVEASTRRHARHAPHGSGAGAASHSVACATASASRFLPTPSGPSNSIAGGRRSRSSARASTARTRSWPRTSASLTRPPPGRGPCRRAPATAIRTRRLPIHGRRRAASAPAPARRARRSRRTPARGTRAPRLRADPAPRAAARGRAPPRRGRSKSTMTSGRSPPVASVASARIASSGKPRP